MRRTTEYNIAQAVAKISVRFTTKHQEEEEKDIRQVPRARFRFITQFNQFGLLDRRISAYPAPYNLNLSLQHHPQKLSA